jgi:hypothetical protein
MLLTARQTQFLAAELWHRAADVNTCSVSQEQPYGDIIVAVWSPRGMDEFVLPPNGEPVNTVPVRS